MSVSEWYRSALCEDYREDLTTRILDDPGFPGFVGKAHAVEGGELNAVACEVACHAVEYLDDNPGETANDAYAELRRRLQG
ncbi:hypothetical protein [Streptomyces chattanoogensis]|uniref:Uncharacterized protein n=1 Tax=Streptomyces chattanoogensis TaxID=66876 RepID=A0A0N1JZN7_9ACTN|nr:hypothetical protein [Streptomyces chattanoogensis]KPC66515.1 hypothetical protein ADL29_03510 [Streptomyces chattanoogensis]